MFILTASTDGNSSPACDWAETTNQLMSHKDKRFIRISFDNHLVVLVIFPQNRLITASQM